MNIPAIALGIAITAIAASAGMANPGTSSVQCGIAKTTQNGMLALEGTLTSPVAVSGEYRFAIQSSSNGGSSNISQGGYFSAKANEATPLGKVLVNAGSAVDINFNVTANGKKLDCGKELASLL